jgi:UDP-glucose 4-epimerase/UDP-glucuronate 4-epimerase
MSGVLVTGASGFVGINVVERLLDAGERVVAVDRKSFPIDQSETASRNRARLTSVTLDVAQSSHVDAAFRELQVDGVVHAAAITADAAREAREARRIVEVNVLGTINVLTAARDAACRRFVYVGSGQAYGATHDEGSALVEDRSPSRPADVYGISKFAAERIVLRLGELWQTDVVAVRLGSVCGPWEVDTGVRDMLSPYFQVTRLAIRGEAAVIPEHEPRRDWIYSRDVAEGVARVLLAPAPSHRLYHLSSGMDWHGRFRDWCDVLRHAYPRFSWRLADRSTAPSVSFIVDRDRSAMNIDRMVEDLDYKPCFGPEAAFQDYIAWIRSHEATFGATDEQRAGR